MGFGPCFTAEIRNSEGDFAGIGGGDTISNGLCKDGFGRQFACISQAVCFLYSVPQIDSSPNTSTKRKRVSQLR